MLESGSIRSTIGIAKASVLPEPVGLLARTSPPRNASGMTRSESGTAHDALPPKDVAHGVGNAERCELVCHVVELLVVDETPSPDLVDDETERDLTGEPDCPPCIHGSTGLGSRPRKARVAIALVGSVELLLEQPQPVLESGRPGGRARPSPRA